MLGFVTNRGWAVAGHYARVNAGIYRSLLLFVVSFLAFGEEKNNNMRACSHSDRDRHRRLTIGKDLCLLYSYPCAMTP